MPVTKEATEITLIGLMEILGCPFNLCKIAIQDLSRFDQIKNKNYNFAHQNGSHTKIIAFFNSKQVSEYFNIRR